MANVIPHHVFRRRLSLLQRSIKRLAPGSRSALLIGSAARRSSTADQHYPFRQSSDFLFLTGSEDMELLLLIDSSARRPVLIAPPISKFTALWEGRPPSRELLAKNLGAELVVASQPVSETLARLKGVDCLYYQNEEGSVAFRVAEQIFHRAPHLRGGLPQKFCHVQQLLQDLRVHKNPTEVKLISEAAQVTNSALFDVVPCLTPGVSEHFVASSIEFFFKARGCEEAFDTNVSAGASAAVLHHTPGEKLLKRGELVLIDCGAAKAHYASDITRVLPVGGKFSDLQRVIYEGVLEAQRAAIKRVRHGALVRDVYLAAAGVLTETLLEVKVLRGKWRALMEKKAFLPYFPHGIGHTLGLDVHDVGDLRGNTSARLEKGMVFTVEPGLYFGRRTGRVPALGVRIEDDVLVTERGCKILTDGFPKDPEEVERLAAC